VVSNYTYRSFPNSHFEDARTKEFLSTNEDSSRDRTETISVAMFSEELYEWGWSELLEGGSAQPHHTGETCLIPPQPSLATVGYTHQPGQLMNQSQEGKELISHRTIPPKLVDINNWPRDITFKGSYLLTLSCIVLRFED